MSLYGAISPNIPDNVSESVRKVILFDPTELYKRIKIDPYKRWQSISMSAWPEIPGYYSCGCETKLKGRQTRWAGDGHADVMFAIIRIIQGNSDTIRRIMQAYLPLQCATCGISAYQQEKITQFPLSNGRTYTQIWSQSGIHADHIIPVKKGGGGCWLGNFQFLCHVCNLQKGNKIDIEKPKPLPLSACV